MCADMWCRCCICGAGVVYELTCGAGVVYVAQVLYMS